MVRIDDSRLLGLGVYLSFAEFFSETALLGSIIPSSGVPGSIFSSLGGNDDILVRGVCTVLDNERMSSSGYGSILAGDTLATLSIP
jgi:hypothetical protein